jgi:hypothetical protein
MQEMGRAGLGPEAEPGGPKAERRRIEAADKPGPAGVEGNRATRMGCR